MTHKYSLITTPTLIITGQNDRLLPSAREGQRLLNSLNNTKVELLEFKDSGHAILDGSIDLAEVMAKSKTFTPPKPPTINITMPSDEEISKFDSQFGTFMKGLSPIFLTRTADNRVVRGIETLPSGASGRPVLFVGNHQLYGTCLSLFVWVHVVHMSYIFIAIYHICIKLGSKRCLLIYETIL